MAPKPNNTEALVAQIMEKLEFYTENLEKGQDKLSGRFDTLNQTYNQLASRLAHVEAKDFNSVILKIDTTSQKILTLENNYSNFEDRLDTLESFIRKQEDKIILLINKTERIQLYINITLFALGSVFTPLMVAWASKVFFGPNVP
jgi:chromosome segregation ATPase